VNAIAFALSILSRHPLGRPICPGGCKNEILDDHAAAVSG
jgi:hypothetical protein